MIADLRDVFAFFGWARSIPARLRPAPKAPTWRKLRRVMPSQKRERFPQMVNIGNTPLRYGRFSNGGSFRRRGKMVESCPDGSGPGEADNRQRIWQRAGGRVQYSQSECRRLPENR